MLDHVLSKYIDFAVGDDHGGLDQLKETYFDRTRCIDRRALTAITDRSIRKFRDTKWMRAPPRGKAEPIAAAS
jgi:hypothetical protein